MDAITLRPCSSGPMARRFCVRSCSVLGTGVPSIELRTGLRQKFERLFPPSTHYMLWSKWSFVNSHILLRQHNEIRVAPLCI
ncbi:hypothetical protein C8Q70DRAFT_1007018 [Cubamyces menziesii]|nr:hypothetical protein C8Q70DRAFT_1007018 [Cubamyces menziesii]